LIQRQRAGCDLIYRLLPRGVVRGIFLWFHKQKHEAEWYNLRADIAAEREALREPRKSETSVRTWREFVERRASAGDEAAATTLRSMQFRERPRTPSPQQPDPERELAAMRRLLLVDVAARFGYELALGSRREHASIRMKGAAGDVIVVKQDQVRG